MNEPTPLDEVKEEAGLRGKDPKTRKLLSALFALWLFTLAVLLGVTWNAYFGQKEKTQTLAEQIAFACASGDFGPGVSQTDEDAMCENAQQIIKNNGEIQEGEIQEPEHQDPEFQDPEIQNPEIQNPEHQNIERQNQELQELEVQNSEIDDPETQDPEIQDEETQDPEIQDEETQDPEIDDPDPNDQINSGSCTFDGYGTITFTFETSSGPVTFQCTGTLVGPPPPNPGGP